MVMANMWSRRGGCLSSLTLIQRQFFKPLVAVVQSLSRVPLFVTPWTVARQAPLSMGSPGKNTGVSCHSLPQGIFLTQGQNPCLLHWQADS